MAGAMVLAAGAMTPAHSAQVINLTAIDGYPPRALWVKEFISYLIPNVNKKLAATGNYRINWNQAWAGQIVKSKGVMGGMQKGLGDIGVVTTVFHADKVPLQMVAYATPFVTTNPGLVAKTVDGLVETFPEYKKTWSKFNQVYLTNAAVLDTYQVFSKQPLTTLADFKGKKVAGAGMNLRWLKGFGAAGVGGSLVGYYNKLKTGVVDAAIIWAEAAISFKIVEVAPNMLKSDLGTVNSKAITMNKGSWDKLPGEVKKIIRETAVQYRDHLGTLATNIAAEKYADYTAKGGKITNMPADQRKAWAYAMPNVAKSWAASLDKKGLPGSKVLASYMDSMRSAGQPIVRQWDKE